MKKPTKCAEALRLYHAATVETSPVVGALSMFEKLQRAFWKALTPDLVAETVTASTPSLLSAEVLSALGGEGNVTSQQRVALTRVRVQLKEGVRLDESALKAAGIPAVTGTAGRRGPPAHRPIRKATMIKCGSRAYPR